MALLEYDELHDCVTARMGVLWEESKQQGADMDGILLKQDRLFEISKYLHQRRVREVLRLRPSKSPFLDR